MSEGDGSTPNQGKFSSDTYTQPADGLGAMECEMESMLPVNGDVTGQTSNGELTPPTPASAESNGETHSIDNGTALSDNDTSWKIGIEQFSSAHVRRHRKPGDKKPAKKLRKFYKAQDELIEQFELTYNEKDEKDPAGTRNTADKAERIAGICARVSFGVNLLLFIGKMVATVLSGSLAIMSSVVDSAVDLISGVVMWYTSSAMKKRDYFKYPEGKKRMEPLAVLIISVLMSVASAMVILKSAEQMEAYSRIDDPDGPVIDAVSISLICITVVLKLILFLAMFRIKSPSVAVLAQDHRNDVCSNIVALIMGFIGYKYWVYADPIGAILIALYILVGWCMTAYAQVLMLTGKTAGPDFLKKITWMTMNHHKKIEAVDLISAFHFGVNFLVEVHIVLPEMMVVHEAHDIQESLQSRLEELDEVERAFVHIDYETTHHFYEEHKMV